MDKTRAGIQSVEVGYGLLGVLAGAQEPLMLRDLALAAGMSAAKAHRYLVSYQRLGLVVQDGPSTRYELGPAALQLGLAALARLDAVKLARERLPSLLAELGPHTVALAVWGNRGPTIVHWTESPYAVPVSLRLGDVMPLLSSATGRCFAAHLPPETCAPMLARELAQAKASRPDLPHTARAFEALLKEVHQHGLARVVEAMLPGVAGFCAPVFDANQRLALGMVALGSTAHFDPAWDGAIARPLRAAAQQLSADLGCKP